ncbi:MAG: S8 family serine peptidase [Actinomycetota bacterium]
MAAVGIAVLLATAVGAGAGNGAPLHAVAVGYTDTAALRQIVRTTHAAVVRTIGPLRIAELRGVAPARLRALPGVRFVQRVSPRVESGATATAQPAASPQWEFGATHTDIVPDSVNRAAAGITVAVVDTGADLSAPAIQAKQPLTWNTRLGTSDVRDLNGHGTFVSSLVAGASGYARLMVVKSGSDGGSFTDVDEAAGITYAVDHGAKVINLSFGGPRTSTTERRAVQYEISHGDLVVASAGNEFQSGNPVEYPAALLQPVGSNGVGGAGLAVTATTSAGLHASFANTGSWVSLAAPGDHVFGSVSVLSSPIAYPRTALPGAKTGLYGFGSGTSFATPLVSGAAALVWAANPALTAAQVAEILKETASGAGRWTPELGFGVIDVAAAVARAQQWKPSVLISGTQGKTGIKLNWGGDAASYDLSQTSDGKTRTLLAATKATSALVGLQNGKTYAFTVTALDPNGVPTASATYSVRG